jgi:Zn-dependent alcohol dehydrogenase
MSIRTRLAVLPAVSGPVRVEEAVLPDPGPHQVLVANFASGVCHSNLPRMYGDRKNDGLIGHESTAVVVACGNAVTRVRDGDRVVVTWVPQFGPDGTRRRDEVVISLSGGREIRQSGPTFTWTEKMVVDEQFLVPLPRDLSPISTGVVGCAVITGAGGVLRSIDLQPGQSLAVFGAGGVGLCAIAAARILGASPIIAVDLRDEKLEQAREFGATDVVNASGADPVEAIREITRDPVELDAFGAPIAGVDYAFDCVGMPATMEQIFRAARSQTLGKTAGGTAVLIGVPTSRLELDPMDFHMNQKKYIGSLAGNCRPDRDIPIYLDWFRSGRLDLDALVTRRYRLEEGAEALRALEAGEIQGRAVIEFDNPEAGA